MLKFEDNVYFFEKKAPNHEILISIWCAIMMMLSLEAIKASKNNSRDFF
jgi:hypothetical protein